MNDKSIKEEYNKVHTVELPEIRINKTLTHHELIFKVERYKPFLQKARKSSFFENITSI